MSDEHNPKVLRHAGHPVIHTPNLDALAARGTAFSARLHARARCASRRAPASPAASTSTRSASGTTPTLTTARCRRWHHLLRERGHRVVSIGKLHFRLTGEDHGFSEEQIPMHIYEGKGDLHGADPRRHAATRQLRRRWPRWPGRASRPTPSTTRTSARVRRFGCASRAPQGETSLGCCSSLSSRRTSRSPRRPSITTATGIEQLPMPKLYAREQRPKHPYLVRLRAELQLRRLLRVAAGREKGAVRAISAWCPTWTKTSARCSSR